MMNSKTLKTVSYWLTTGILAFNFSLGGVFYLLHSPQVMSGMAHLGYPTYFVSILGMWKVLAGPALIAPRFPRLKEWAYAGIFFDLTSAALSIAALGDGAGKALIPVLFIGLTLASWTLRPASRVLLAPNEHEPRTALLATES